MNKDCQTAVNRRDKRRRAILDAARKLFLEKGYEATTLGDIVNCSGGSLATLYDLFGSKPGLLKAMVTERCATITEIIDGVMLADLQPAEALREIARRLFEQLNDPDGIALFRVVIAEAPRLPELGRQFYEAGPVAGRRIMAEYLARQTERQSLAVDQPETAATFFFHMLMGEHQMRLLCGLPVSEDQQALDHHIGYVVDTFMRLYALP
jgi:AcrR family transcriptional regulator